MKEALSLLELNNLVKLAIKECFPDKFWVRAELSEVRTTGAGHCYVEFIEKESRSGSITAKMRGNIWANTFRLLKPYFEEETGQLFGSGLKVLVEVTVEFHEIYGPSLTIWDIDPTFTLGDMMRQRLEIIRRLKEEELFDLNKQLILARLPQRLAIISSATAAGYGDFMNQLQNNSGKYACYTRLFPALMQGEQAEQSILKALNKVETQMENFDVVVIIRGGGAVSDLNCFDSYLLAKRCAMFPLPIITGIGHERDESVLDLIAHTRLKTPTAAAEFIISCFEKEDYRLAELQNNILSAVQSGLELEKSRIKSASMLLSHRTQQILNQESTRLIEFKHRVKLLAQQTIQSKQIRLSEWNFVMKNKARQLIDKQENRLNLHEQTIRLVSPEVMLKRGYTLTTRNGKIVRSANELKAGETVKTYFADGTRESIITNE